MLEEWIKKIKEQKDKGLVFGSGEKSKYLLILIVSIGLIALLWPSTSSTEKVAENLPRNDVSSQNNYKAQTTAELESILSSIEGAGVVKVSLTLASDGLKTYAANIREEKRDTQEQAPNQVNKKTVEETMNQDITVSSGNPLLVENKTPQVTGVLVVAEGAANMRVKEELIKAAATLLNLPFHKVEVVSKQGGI